MVSNYAKAIVVRDRNILVLVKEDDEGIRYVLPGGKQEEGETLSATLRRECREEIGIDVNIGSLLFVREYVKLRRGSTGTVQRSHRIDFLFQCNVDADYEPRMGVKPDPRQTGVAWLELERLSQCRFSPTTLSAYLSCGDAPRETIYLNEIEG